MPKTPTPASSEAPQEMVDFTISGMLTPAIAAILAKEIVARTPGEKFEDKFEFLQTFFKEVRDARDANKTSRPRRTVAELLADAIGKPMSELQAIKFEVGGVSLPVPQIAKLAAADDDKAGPLKPFAVEFLKKNGLKVVTHKMSSKGKDSTLLVGKDWVPPAPLAKAA